MASGVSRLLSLISDSQKRKSVADAFRILSADEGQEVTQNQSVNIKAEVQSRAVTAIAEIMSDQLQTVQAELTRIQQFVDGFSGPLFSQMRYDITDIQSAYAARELYSLTWFYRQPYSYQVLMRVANTLLVLTKPYFARPVEMWEKIASGDFTVFEAIEDQSPSKVPGSIRNVASK